MRSDAEESRAVHRPRRAFERYLQRPNRRRLAAVVKHYYRHVWSVALRLTGHRDDAMDISQDVFLALLLNPPAAGTVRSPRGYLASRVMTLGRRLRQAARRRHAREERAARQLLVEQDAEPADTEAMLEAIDHLPDRIRNAMELRYLAGLRNREIALSLGVSERSVEADLKQGREILRKRLGEGAVAGLALFVSMAGQDLARPPAHLYSDLLRVIRSGKALGPVMATTVATGVIAKSRLQELHCEPPQAGWHPEHGGLGG